MEKDERERIRGHLHDLVIFTICDAELLSFCYQMGVLSVADVDKITAIKEHIGKACEFYHIIQTKTDAYEVLKNALLQTSQTGIVEILEKGIVPPTLDVETRVRKILHDEHSDKKRLRLEAPLPQQPTVHVPIFDVSAPVPLFTGRRKELEELHEKILRSSGNGHPTVISQLTSISGLGGIGKTQLSRQYVKEQRSHFDDNCIWLDAETENSLGDSFRTLAKDRLDIKTTDANGSQKKIHTVVSEVYQFFEDRKCLFIFDNAERAAWFKQFLPVISTRPDVSKPYMLITSRTREWDKGIEVVDLNELKLNDAIELVKKGLGLEEDTSQDDDITKLVKRLQCFPLAIQQAISYIEYQTQTQKGYSVQVYLGEFEKRQEELLSFDEMNNEILNDYNMTTLTTWKMTVEKIAKDSNYGEVALKMLYAMAYLSPEKINREVFIRLEGISNEEAMIGGLRLLARYSMVRGEDSLSFVSIHRLVQEVTRLELISTGKETEILENVLGMLSLPDKSVPAKNVDHMLGLWQHVWKYPEVLQRFSYLPAEMMWGIYWKGRDNDAIRFVKENKDKLAEGLGEDNNEFLDILHCLCPSLLRQGMIDEAIKTSHYVMEKRKALFGEIDRRTLPSFNNLGLIYFRQARFEEAIPHIEKAFSIAKIIFPEDDPMRISGTLNLGAVLLKLGRAHEALNIFQELYEQQKICNQKKGKRTFPIRIRTGVGDCLNELEDFDGALKILHEDLEKMTELSAEERMEMRNLVHTIGKALRNKGSYEEALEKHKQAYHDSVDIFGANHVETIMSKAEIALDLVGMKRFEEAISMFRDVTQKLEGALGGDHFKVVRLKLLYADALIREGKDVKKALGILDEQKEKIKEKGWEDLAFFRNNVCKLIHQIENDIASLKI